MSAILKAMAESQKTYSKRPMKPAGNIVLKPTEFTDQTVKGVVMSGVAAGQEIEVVVPDNGRDAVSVKKFIKPSTATTSSYVDIEAGGTIRVEKLKEGANGVYTARWMNVFDGRPQEGSDAIYNAVVQLRTTAAKTEGDPDIMRLIVLHPEEEQRAATMEELAEKIEEAFATRGAVHVFIKEGDFVGSFPYTLGGQKVDDEWVPNDPKERAAYVIETFGDRRALFEEAMKTEPFSVVPSQSITVGPTTGAGIMKAIAEAREKGEAPRINTIDPTHFEMRRTALRVAYAFNRNPERTGLAKDAPQRFKARFLENASQEVKDLFRPKGPGWTGVSDDDMRRFFESQGIELAKYPSSGWTVQNIVLKNGIATKTFGQTDATPFPARLEICKDAVAAYDREIVDAIHAVVEAPAKTAQAEVKKEAVQPESAAPSAQAASSDADIDDLDALLDGVQDADMDV
jgi:hypothetical protein